MTKPAQVALLADFAHDELGSIDLWCVAFFPLDCFIVNSNVHPVENQ